MPTLFEDPDNIQRINELYAVFSTDENGDGLVSCRIHGQNFPMVFGHKNNLDMLRDEIKIIAKNTKKKLLIVKFSNREVLETIE